MPCRYRRNPLLEDITEECGTSCSADAFNHIKKDFADTSLKNESSNRKQNLSEGNHKRCIRIIRRIKKGKVDYYIPPKRYAMIVGYNGARYFGYQKQLDLLKTVEGELENAIVSAGGKFSKGENLYKESSLGWSRAARTDKRVHAICQLVSVKLSIPLNSHMLDNLMLTERIKGNFCWFYSGDEDFEPHDIDKILQNEGRFLDAVNQFLSQDIQLFRFLSVSKRFNARILCETRTYEYVFPIEILTLHDNMLEEDSLKESLMTNEQNVFEKLPEKNLYVHDNRINGELKRQENFFVKEKFLKIIKTYEGVHNFHNFTSGSTYQDPKNIRKIIKISAREDEILNFKVLIVEITGNSFLLHQIRKMMGLAIQVYRGSLDQSEIINAFGNEKKFLHIAPGDGLIFLQPCYKMYNECRTNPPVTPHINFSEIEDTTTAFKKLVIYREIAKSIDNKVWHKWLRSIKTSHKNKDLNLK